MDFKQLRSFVAVADCGSFTQAAAQLYTSQPTVSAHIRQLEEELQQRLEGTLRSLRDVGYLNYYGLQRFGNEGKNVEIGCLMLRNEWEAAVMAILRSNRSGGMVEALRVYEDTKDGLEALKVSVERGGDAQKLPRYMSTEIALFRALGKSGGKGFSVGVWRASEA